MLVEAMVNRRESDVRARILRRYEAALMNNTKWRMVWTALTELRAPFKLAMADADDWNADHADRVHRALPPSLVEDWGIADPGVGGPFLYVQILSVSVPEPEPRSPEADTLGMPFQSVHDHELLRTRLLNIGELPLREEPQELQIWGYALG